MNQDDAALTVAYWKARASAAEQALSPLRRVEELCEALARPTPTFHAVVAGQHLDNCIACVIRAELVAALSVEAVR